MPTLPSLHQLSLQPSKPPFIIPKPPQQGIPAPGMYGRRSAKQTKRFKTFWMKSPQERARELKRRLLGDRNSREEAGGNAGGEDVEMVDTTRATL